MFGLNVVAADTDVEARRLFSSLQQAFMALRTGHPGPLPPPVDDIESRLDEPARAMLGHALSQAIVGSPTTVRDKLADFIGRTGADEVMITSSIFDHPARLHSFEIVAQAHGQAVADSLRSQERDSAARSSVA
jgi:alkanesulfonate monooxygenase SsuD/methylene tetrahydromethanopterin reductase-like flavin-dependent oxidoreductase (luciferase family)